MPSDRTSDSTGGRRPPGTAGRNRNAYCSFCRRSHRDVGPLVEGPGDVYICGECIELCQSIIDQEKKRRGGPKSSSSNIPAPRTIKEKLDAYVIDQDREAAGIAGGGGRCRAHLFACAVDVDQGRRNFGR